MPSKKRRMRLNRRRFLDELPGLMASADAGDLDSQHDLAAFYASDDLSGLKDAGKALALYERAAEQGHAESQYDLGFMLLLGEGAEADVGKGLRWVELAANNGLTYAALLLSDIYGRGLYGEPADEEKATYWKQRSAADEDRI